MTPLPELEPAALDAARKAVGRRLGTAMWPDAEEAIRAYLSAARSTVPWTPEFDAMVAADPILSRAASIICGVACGSYSHCLSREAAVALRDAGLLASVPAPSGAAERNTHLLEWLNDGWTHCQHGTREWCEGYLHNARDVIRAQDAALTASEAEATSLRRKLGELLAVIHRDGGHYQDFAGTEQAVADAQSAVVLLFQAQDERNDLRRKLEEAERQRDEVIRKSAAYNPTEREGRAIMDEAAAIERAEAAERKLEEYRKALEPFYTVAKALPDPRLINDEAPGVMDAHMPAFGAAVGNLTLGDFRRVFWLVESQNG